VDRWRDRIEKYYSIDRERFPQRRVIGTESSGMGGTRGSYGGLLPAAPGAAAAPAGAFGFGGRAGGRPNTGTELLWKFVSTYDYVAGDHMWTGIDYLGESRWPGKGASSGVIDSCGFAKDGYYFYQSVWTKKPMLHLLPHWNWKGREGQFVPVTVYTNCDSVELFINGKSAGVLGYQYPRVGMADKYGNYPPGARGMRTTTDLHLSWTIPYEPGTLRAVGTKDGKPAVTVEVSTTGEPAGIDLKVDRDAINANRDDVVHYTVRIVDAQGRMIPDAAHEVTFDVQGEGKLIGVDNGDMQSHDDYKAKSRKALNGMCLAIVQSTAKPGQIRLTASSPGLKPASVTVTTRATG
jgi:beta-galactosidase